jgi:hypothetical protein
MKLRIYYTSSIIKQFSFFFLALGVFESGPPSPYVHHWVRIGCIQIACQKKSVRITCQVIEGSVRIACHVSEVYIRIACRFDFSNFFYYLFLISWDAIFYQSIFSLILTLVIPFLSIIDNISEI